jgi:hypothetical protein
MPHRKVVYPSPKDWANQLDHPPHRLTGIPSEHIPELPQQCCPLLQLRRIVGPPRSLTTQNAAKFEIQKSKTVPLCEGGKSAFLIVDLNPEFWLTPPAVACSPPSPASHAADERRCLRPGCCTAFRVTGLLPPTCSVLAACGLSSRTSRRRSLYIRALAGVPDNRALLKRRHATHVVGSERFIDGRAGPRQMSSDVTFLQEMFGHLFTYRSFGIRYLAAVADYSTSVQGDI